MPSTGHPTGLATQYPISLRPLTLSGNPVLEIVEFCRFARENGISGGVGETLSSVFAVATLPRAGREELKSALKAVMCSSQPEWEIFDHIFETFWRGSGDRPDSVVSQLRPSAQPQTRIEDLRSGLIGEAVADAKSLENGKGTAGANARERLMKTDFSLLCPNDLIVLEQLSMRLLKQMSLRLSRRLKAARLTGLVDLRRTIRKSIGRGGDPIELGYRGKRRRPNPLVILLDVSGSMNAYSLFLLRFAYVMQKRLSQVHTFVFSTSLVEATSALRSRGLADALKTLSDTALGWSGGTRIGESLRTFNRLYGKDLLSRNTFFLILSDGWETGDSSVLAYELAAVRRRVSKVIWLNPLLGLEGYEPITRGMSAALPHIDVFAPAHNLHSLLRLEDHLSGRAAQPCRTWRSHERGVSKEREPFEHV